MQQPGLSLELQVLPVTCLRVSLRAFNSSALPADEELSSHEISQSAKHPFPSMPPGSALEELSGGHVLCFTLSCRNLPKPRTLQLKRHPDPREKAVLKAALG